jgi:Protein of unknown function (DUF3341)
MRRQFIVAIFTTPDVLMRAVRTVREHNFRIYDVYAPYPIHNLDQAMGIRRTRLPWVTLIAGVCGMLTAIGFEFYANVFDWPLNVGGKPDNSTLAFLPITFELTVLVGGLSTLAALLLRARLFPGKRERLPVARVTDDRFALVLRKREEGFDSHAAYNILISSGARAIKEMEAEL